MLVDDGHDLSIPPYATQCFPTWYTTSATTYATEFMYRIMNNGHRHPPVSRRTTATVLMHCIASTNQTSRLTATSGVQTGLPSPRTSSLIALARSAVSSPGS